jgi:hypothetical protein
MPIILFTVFSLVGLYLLHFLLGLKSAARNVGSVLHFYLKIAQLRAVDQVLCYFYSNLPGLFYFFSPLSVPGYILARTVRHVPYLHVGSSWVARRKYEGANAS